jgi:hypothetical protein
MNILHFTCAARRCKAGGDATKLEIIIYLLCVSFSVGVVIGYWGLYFIDPGLIDFESYEAWDFEFMVNLYIHAAMVIPVFGELFINDLDLRQVSWKRIVKVSVGFVSGYSIW